MRTGRQSSFRLVGSSDDGVPEESESRVDQMPPMGLITGSRDRSSARRDIGCTALHGPFTVWHCAASLTIPIFCNLPPKFDSNVTVSLVQHQLNYLLQSCDLFCEVRN